MPKLPKPIKIKAGQIIGQPKMGRRRMFTPKIGLNLGMNPPPKPT